MSDAATRPDPFRSPSTAADEVARFAALADSWWDEEGPFKPLHRLNPTRLAFIRDGLCDHFSRDSRSPRSLAGLRVLDVGCGGGLLCEPLCRLGAEVTGIDAAAESVAVARAHAQALGLDIRYRVAAPETLASEGLTFDAVINMEVIEHVEDIDVFLGACSDLVARDGMMLLSTLNRTWKSLALGKVAAEYLLGWVPPGTHDWRRFVKPSEMARGLRRRGMALSALRGMTYDPATDGWRLSDDVTVNYMAAAVKT